MADHDNSPSGNERPRRGRNDEDTVSVERARLLETVINSTPALIAYWDTDLRCRFGNTHFASWFDSTPEDIQGQDMASFIDARAFAAVRPVIDVVLSGVPQQLELPLARADGARVLAVIHYTPDIRDGGVVGFTTYAIDGGAVKESEETLRGEVAERQRANRIIRAAAAALEEAQRLGQIGSWTWTQSPDVVAWSKELYRIMGRDAARPPPSFAEHGQIYVHESWERLRAAVERALKTGEPYQVRLEYVRPDGVTGWVDARGEAIRDRSGALIGLRGTVQVVPGRESDRQRKTDQGPPDDAMSGG